MHGGPFGPQTLNPFRGDVQQLMAGHWPGVNRPVAAQSMAQYEPAEHSGNPFYGRPWLQNMINVPASFLETGSKTAATAGQKATAKATAATTAQTEISATAHAKARARARMMARHPHPPPCYQVCPKQEVARPDDEPFGGPFGPDPYFSRGKRMFNDKGGQRGFSGTTGHFRNFQNEPYGGPFGADPHYIYGNPGTPGHSSGPLRAYGFPPL